MMIAQTGTSALLVDPDGYLTSQRQLLVCSRPAMRYSRCTQRAIHATAGGLISYDTSFRVVIGKPASTPGGFSRVPRPQTFRSDEVRNLSHN
jgi:hypothetical protein